jgi:hypothetical protein
VGNVNFGVFLPLYLFSCAGAEQRSGVLTRTHPKPTGDEEG